MLYSVAIFSVLFHSLPLVVAANPISVKIPGSPPSTHVVQQNFLGISFELSFMDEYFGNDTSTIPPTIVNYLAALRSRVGENSLRIRVGGNSMDSSTYVPSQLSPMVQMLDQAANSNNQPVNYGPVLWDVLDKVSSDIGGASFLIGLSLLDPNNPNVALLAGGAAEKLGDNLDGFLLGNEPDLYTSHQMRPNIQNYTTALYIDEFRTASNHLTTTSAGNILEKHNIGGPTLCCSWNLDALLDDGYTAAFGDELKFISLQHYPQNNCAGSHIFDIPYYLQHPNVVSLAAWQNSGISKVISSTGPNRQDVIMSEFNSASCGGVPSVSDSFAVGSLWTIDYALQMASGGYSAAYLHTRERGISYNLFTPPDGPNGSPGDWITNPPFYGLLVTAEALGSTNGSIVVDLDVASSKSDINSTVSGYAVYDATDSTVHQLVFFNYANTTSSASSSAEFVIPANTFEKTATVKYLVGDNLAETKNIGWGGETFANVGNGKLVASKASWAPPNLDVDCSKGCTISVPSPGMAVVFSDKESAIGSTTSPKPTASTITGPVADTTGASKNIGSRTNIPFSLGMIYTTVTFIFTWKHLL